MKSGWLLSGMIVGLAALAGCQTNHAIVRGQNPPPNAAAMSPASGPTPGPVYYDGPAGAHAMSCPTGHCHPAWARYPADCPENYHWPQHHHTYEYRQPKNLVYPPHNQPAGVVVYPYYTCKGPSDFFLK